MQLEHTDKRAEGETECVIESNALFSLL